MKTHYAVGTYRLRTKNGRFSSFKIALKNFFRRVLRVGMFGLVIYVAFIAGRYIAPTETIVNVVEAESKIPPVMQRIAKCESGGRHFDVNGQILMRSNTNRSVDVGKYQINTVWFKKATEMGLDITKEVDNEKFAMWIYENRGTGDWYSSAKCWQNK
jgi:hypothetical protein